MTDDFENRLRDMMREQSAHAPDDYPVVQQVLRDVTRRPSVEPRRSPWRTWLIPVVAAGAVAAVAATVVGVQNFRPSAHHTITPGISNSPDPSVPAPSNSQAPTTPPPTNTNSAQPNALGLTNFHVIDLTWVGDNGWALGTADCLNASGSTCVAMARTVNGNSWVSSPTPPADVAQQAGGGCSAGTACIAHVRFATDKVGYAFGTSGFFVTADGGTTWKAEGSQSTPILALETLENNVIRVVSDCLPGCRVSVQTAAIDSNAWTTRTLPGNQPSMQSGATLIRVQGTSYLDIYGHVAGGASNAQSTMFVSTDRGATWANKSEPCPQTGGGAAGNEVDSTAIASGGGTFAVLCTPRGGTQSFVELSSDQGQTYQPVKVSIPNESFGGPLAVSGQIVLVAGQGGLYRSTNGGGAWNKVDLANVGIASWLGFESVTDARAVSGDGRTIWTTHDAGAHWTATTFP